jgi:predicted lipid-binding transport protein (Tim44 family)
MSLDPLNILLLAVALVVFWRLRSVLGTRTGNERPPLDSSGGPADEPRKEMAKTGSVLRFPQSEEKSSRPAEESETAPPVWEGIAESGTAIAAALEQIAEKDPTFQPRAFLEGAKQAYEMIIEGFAKGDKSILKNLLSKEVFDGFSEAIDAREEAGQRVDQRFVGITSARLVAAGLTGKRSSMTVEFVSELISATLAKTGDVVDGDLKSIREVTDVWTFERDVSSRDPNWKLAATQAQA